MQKQKKIFNTMRSRRKYFIGRNFEAFLSLWQIKSPKIIKTVEDLNNKINKGSPIYVYHTLF